jgi:hypothetical protein
MWARKFTIEFMHCEGGDFSWMDNIILSYFIL